MDPTDFVVSGTTATLSLSPATECLESYEATLSGGDLAGLNGTVGLTVSEDQNIWGCLGDGEEMTHPGPLGANETFVVDNAAPALAITGVPANTTGRLHRDLHLRRGSHRVPGRRHHGQRRHRGGLLGFGRDLHAGDHARRGLHRLGGLGRGHGPGGQRQRRRRARPGASAGSPRRVSSRSSGRARPLPRPTPTSSPGASPSARGCATWARRTSW